jgi:hypothetical protein
MMIFVRNCSFDFLQENILMLLLLLLSTTMMMMVLVHLNVRSFDGDWSTGVDTSREIWRRSSSWWWWWRQLGKLQSLSCHLLQNSNQCSVSTGGESVFSRSELMLADHPVHLLALPSFF